MVIGLARVAPCAAVELVQSEQDGPILHLDGFSWHFKPNGQSYENYGLGFAYPIGRFAGAGAWIEGARLDFELDEYRDSYRDPAWAGGLVLTRKLAGPVDWGLKVGVVHTEELLAQGHPAYPYVLPFVETAFDFPLQLRVTLVPPWGTFTNGELTFQLMVDLKKL